ncbi:MAG: helix-turn-helix domain-containing protein [Pirellulaceae bacterium]|nr:helix-turn-helix domain-containing protein [Pirellulaceae bacterium]
MTTVTMPDRSTGRKLADVKTVAAKLDCSPRTVYRLVDAGRMPAPRRIASLLRWDLDEIDQWIEGGCRPVRIVKGGA